MDQACTKAYAKVNIGLDVTGKRDDGYHLVKMVLQTVDLYDEICVRKQEEGITVQTNKPFLPTDERNLAYKAAKMMMDAYDIPCGVRIDIGKNIPVAAGMAGGSTDAAAVLKLMNEIFELEIDSEEMDRIAVKLGADVPFCLRKGTYLAEGIGEKLTRLEPVPHCYVLVGKPGISVSTKEAYGNLNLQAITQHPDIDGMMQDMKNGDLYGMVEKMQNVFEPGIIANHPEIQQIKDLMEENGALKAMMSGSGPTVFGIFDDKEKMNYAADRLRTSHLAKTVFATEVFNVAE